MAEYKTIQGQRGAENLARWRAQQKAAKRNPENAPVSVDEYIQRSNDAEAERAIVDEADAILRGARRLKDLAVDIVDTLATIMHRAPKYADRIEAARILLEHALGKPVRAAPDAGTGTTLTWEQLLERAKAEARKTN